MGKGKGITVLDLFCGAGGFSEGFHMAGFDVVMGIDFWKPACETHGINGLGEGRKLDLLNFGVDEALTLKRELEDAHGAIDVIIGSPPCTEFSYAKNGGRGDIEKGMFLVRKHLLFMAVFRPKYWMMENVPRLKDALKSECEVSADGTWTISYEKLGIPTGRRKELGLEGTRLQIPVGEVFTASDYGTHENRKRFIAGDYPISMIEKVDDHRDVSLGGILDRLNANMAFDNVEDPNYPGNHVRKGHVRDYHYNTEVHPMYLEEMRHLKRRHIQYGKMALPDELSSPARTIMATASASSRESILIDTGRRSRYHHKLRPVYRQPTVREVACIQGFPLNFQLKADNLNDRYKLVGNAVPCQLSYALAKAVARDVSENINGEMDGFHDRARVTLSRHNPVDGDPIISKPVVTVGEAFDRGKKAFQLFKADPRKRLRRKMRSSKLENDSAVVVFENEVLVDGKIRGGVRWKACLQKGSGKSYHRVYLDAKAVQGLISSLNASLDLDWKPVVKRLFDELDKGLLKTREGWVEFPGHLSMQQEYLDLIQSKGRAQPPSVTMLQRMFTEHMPDTGGIAGPLDIFDGLDCIMLRTMNDLRFRHYKKSMGYISMLRDKVDDESRVDKKGLPSIEDSDLPFVTIIASFLAVRFLNDVYNKDEELKDSEEAKMLAEGLELIISAIDGPDA